MKAENLNRREILVLGKNLLLTSLLAGASAGCSISSATNDEEWQNDPQPLDRKGMATVKYLSGAAFADAKPMIAGEKLPSGIVVDLVQGGRLVLALPDRSVLQLKDQTRLKLDLDSKQGGDLTLKYGSMVSVITPRRRSRHYRIKGVSALIGVKGTVSFLQVFKPGAVRDPKIPPQATEYFCICNGAIDYLDPVSRVTAMSDSAEHHSPHFLYPKRGGVGFIKTNLLLNHNDREILKLMGHMEGEKHDTSWLNPNSPATNNY